MNIRWDKEPETPELRTLANYLMDHLSIVDRMIGISSRHDLLTLSFTPQPFEQSFFTFEIKRGTFSRAYHIIVWGVFERGMPCLFFMERLRMVSRRMRRTEGLPNGEALFIERTGRMGLESRI